MWGWGRVGSEMLSVSSLLGPMWVGASRLQTSAGARLLGCAGGLQACRALPSEPPSMSFIKWGTTSPRGECRKRLTRAQGPCVGTPL